MSRLPVFTETAEGNLVQMRPSAPETEDSLQALIAQFPEVIAGGKGPLLLVKREHGVPDEAGGSGRWSLDNMYVTSSAIPVLVEVKRASDTRIRREVVAQMMDYAANAVTYWTPGTLQKSFIETCEAEGLEPELTLRAFLDGDTEGFWEQVDSNLEAGRIRLLFVADEIPKELARIIEFLNDQMRADVLGVELVYYASADGRRTLAPRLVGETELSKAGKASNPAVDEEKLSLLEWIDRFLPDQETQSAYHRFATVVEKLGGELVVSDAGSSIIAMFPDEVGKIFYPFSVSTSGRLSVTFVYMKFRPALADLEVREEFLGKFVDALGPSSTGNASGAPSFSLVSLNDALSAQRFESAAASFVRLGEGARS